MRSNSQYSIPQWLSFLKFIQFGPGRPPCLAFQPTFPRWAAHPPLIGARIVEFWPWAVDIDCKTWGQFFLKFIMAHPSVTCVIPGTSKPHHMMDNVAAGYGRLPGLRDRDRMAAYVESL